MEIVRLIMRTFDTMENRHAESIHDQCLGTFVAEDGLSAHGVASEWLEQHPPIKVYLAWDGQVYPQFRVVVETANKKEQKR